MHNVITWEEQAAVCSMYFYWITPILVFGMASTLFCYLKTQKELDDIRIVVPVYTLGMVFSFVLAVVMSIAFIVNICNIQECHIRQKFQSVPSSTINIIQREP